MDEYIKLNLFFTKIYLLRTENGFIQFDAGFNLGWYLKALEKLSIDPKEIKLIVVNHAHFDHVGALKALKEISNAKVLVHKNDAEFLRTGTSAAIKPISLPAKILMNLVPKSMRLYEPVEPDIIIKDDYSLQEYGIEAKVIHTPGHTAGTLSIITKKGNAFIGCSAHGFPLRMKPGLPTVAQDINQVLSSWENLVEHGAKTLHVSHGKSISLNKMKKILKKKRETK